MILRGQLYSKVLEMETNITVLAPEELEGEGHYKVVYLLHGLCGRSGDFIEYTLLPLYAKKYKTIFIMPEVARSWYTDMAFGLKYFTYISEELPVICKNLFNISSERQNTGVMGVSMGGYGALKCALTRPEIYGFCGALAPGCLYLREGLAEQRLEGKTKAFRDKIGAQTADDFYAVFGPNLDWRPDSEILDLAKKNQVSENKPVIYVACGNDDFLIESNLRFKEDMDSLSYPFTFEMWQGKHDWQFFDEALQRALQKMHY